MAPDDCSPTFVNNVAVHGFVNGNVNLLFTQIRWYPVAKEDGTVEVAATQPSVVDLRMDLFCAQQVYDALGKYLEEHTKKQTVN